MSAIRSASSGETRAYADASKESRTIGIVVESVERHPGDATILGVGPLRQQGRLAVARRRRHGDHAAIARSTRGDEIEARLTASGRGCGTESFASSSSPSSSSVPDPSR